MIYLLLWIFFYFLLLGDDKNDWEATKKLYKELLTVFDKIILTTHGSCHCQFIMFYICSFKPELSDGFIDYLWKKVQNPSIGPVFRQISSFYIGSFLARAKYISIRFVYLFIKLLNLLSIYYVIIKCDL